MIHALFLGFLFANPATGPVLLQEVATGFEIAASAARVVQFTDQYVFSDGWGYSRDGYGQFCQDCPRMRYYHRRHHHRTKRHK